MSDLVNAAIEWLWIIAFLLLFAGIIGWKEGLTWADLKYHWNDFRQNLAKTSTKSSTRKN